MSLALCQGQLITLKMDVHPLVVGQMKEGDKCLSVAAFKGNLYTGRRGREGFPAGSGVTSAVTQAPAGSLKLGRGLGSPGGLSERGLFRADSEAELLRAGACGVVVLGVATKTGSCWHIPHSFLEPKREHCP